jgi:hypothetical protein
LTIISTGVAPLFIQTSLIILESSLMVTPVLTFSFTVINDFSVIFKEVQKK